MTGTALKGVVKKWQRPKGVTVQISLRSPDIMDSKKKDLLTLLRSHWGDFWQQNEDLSFVVALPESNNQDEDDENEDRECEEVDDFHV
ncbi:unnamed protein product [Euphydryas editha]|uniref:Uncharacterized protein n=1 Tax=Euphydryas editha TaxID=104508 RepID=A0AAU9U799_EUPED|nr:unnamed protein product [Euphydryas editha]